MSVHHLPLAPRRAAPGAFPWLRTFAWSVRRELWEHRAIYLAPSALAALGLVIGLLGSLTLANSVRAARLSDPAYDYMEQYGGLTMAVLVVGWLVAAVYSLGALHGERRDRSILFWKSLPVSDLQTVLSKAAVPLLVTPVAIWTIAVGASLVDVAYTSLIWLLNGFDPRDLWARLDLPYLWLALAYGLPFMALWFAPILAWLLLVSAWARRAPVLWAAAPFVAAAVVGGAVAGPDAVRAALRSRIAGGVLEPFTAGGLGRDWVSGFGDFEPGRLWSLPGLWIGVALAALFLFAAARVRRARGPS